MRKSFTPLSTGTGAAFRFFFIMVKVLTVFYTVSSSSKVSFFGKKVEE